MKRILNQSKYIYAIIVSFGILSLNFAHVSANVGDRTNIPGAQLSVEKSSFEIDPGGKESSFLTVKNFQTTSLKLTLCAIDYKASSYEDGKPEYFVTSDPDKAVSSWVKADSQTSITLKPSETYNYKYSINIPKDTLPGGYYVSVGICPVYDETAAKDSNSLVESKVVIPLQIKVKGDVNASGDVIEFFNTPTASLNQLPSEFVIRFKNDGKVHIKPTGIIKITNIFGTQVGEIKVNSDASGAGLVLPDSIRKYTVDWQSHNGFAQGPLTATLTISFDRNDHETTIVTRKINFFTVSYKLVAGTTITIIVVAIAGVYLFRKFRKKSQIKKKSAKIKGLKITHDKEKSVKSIRKSKSRY
jgi:hypothetical protein